MQNADKIPSAVLSRDPMPDEVFSVIVFCVYWLCNMKRHYHSPTNERLQTAALMRFIRRFLSL